MSFHLGLGTGSLGERGNCGNPNWPAEGEKSKLGESIGYGDLGDGKHPKGRGDDGIPNCDKFDVIVEENGGGIPPWGGAGGAGLVKRGDSNGAKCENPDKRFWSESAAWKDLI